MRVSFFNRSFLTLLCFFIILVHFIQIVYLERSFFLDRYDVSYWRDRFEHSQWQLPASRRIIGDDGLFSYIGYHLVKGGDPGGVNAETPPFGKYLIGLSILLLGNPAFCALFFGIGTLVFFYLICQKIFNNRQAALFLVAILFLDPLFFTQLWKGWVDIIQLFFFLLNLLFLLKVDSSKGKKALLFAGLSGIALGVFLETKVPILFPVILFLETAYFIFHKTKKETCFFYCGILSAILLVYSRYFILGYSIIDFLKLQKYLIAFYLKSKLEVHVGAIWQSLILGRFPDLVTGSPIPVSEWWILWPVISLLSIVMSVVYLFKKGSPFFLRGTAIFLLTTLFIYTIIPAYPRYLLIILPFFYLFSVYAINQFPHLELRRIGFVALLFYGLIHATLSLLPSPQPLLNNLFYNLSHQYFQDIYQENLAKAGRPLSREEFHLISRRALGQATVRAIAVQEQERNVPKFGNKGTVKFRLIYKTQDLGAFSEDKTIELIKEDSQWKVKWDWNILLDNFHPGYSIETTTILGKRGKILSSDGILAEDSTGYLISVNPEKIDTKREDEMLKLMGRYGYKDGVNFQNAYLENSLPGEYIPLITLQASIGDTEKTKLLSYPGVRLTEYPSRLYRGLDPESLDNSSYGECCTRIYSSYNYHGISGPEKTYDALLSGYSGGTIVMKDGSANITRTILEKKAKNGQDVTLP